MSKTIKIQILHQLALNAIKNETFQKAVVDKSVDQKLITAAYHEAAGNEAYHETMLGRLMFSQIEKLKTWFVDYLTGNGGNIAEDATVDSTETDGATDILLQVSDRFNNGYVKTLARLSQKYVEDRCIHLWWAPVSKELSALYLSLADDDLAGILACFTKTAPEAPAYRFPIRIDISYPILPQRGNIPGFITPENTNIITPEMLYGNPWMISEGDVSEISYTLSGENGVAPIDDIVVRADHPCCQPCFNGDGQWCIRGVRTGYSIITLFSRHNDQVFAKFSVRVTPNE